MRKIIMITEVDGESFLPTITIKEKLEDGSIVVIHSAPLEISKYNREQLVKIKECNDVLISKGMNALTESEADYMLDPAGMNKRLTTLEKVMEDTSNLQKLSGFRVEKHIVSLITDKEKQ